MRDTVIGVAALAAIALVLIVRIVIVFGIILPLTLIRLVFCLVAERLGWRSVWRMTATPFERRIYPYFAAEMMENRP
jgi:cobalamin synthase